MLLVWSLVPISLMAHSGALDAAFTHQDEAGVVSVPPAEGRHADFWVLVVMENLTSAVSVSTQDETGLKPLQQLRRENPQPQRLQRPVATHLHHHSHHQQQQQQLFCFWLLFFSGSSTVF